MSVAAGPRTGHRPRGRRAWREHGRFCRRRPGIRRRLTWAFFLVSFLSIALGFWVTGWGGARPTGPGPHPTLNAHVILVALAASWLAGALTAGGITGGLRRLRDAVERIDLRDLSPRVPVEGGDEVADLAQAFNRMIDRLAAEERSRRQLLADVAHELRHPLAVVQGRIEMMLDGAAPLDAEQVLRLQDTVISLSRLVGDLRDLSLAEVGGLSLRLAPVDLAALVADLKENLEPVAAAKRILLTCDVPQGLPAVTADGERLRQVLVNLLANALRYTPEDGRVDLRAGHDGPVVRVEVADTGPGISPEDLAHVFDRFYRADPARSRETGGSGLGLAIVKSLVALHGGTVDARSEPGRGSRFTVTLPVAGPRPASQAAATVQSSAR